MIRKLKRWHWYLPDHDFLGDTGYSVPPPNRLGSHWIQVLVTYTFNDGQRPPKRKPAKRGKAKR